MTNTASTDLTSGLSSYDARRAVSLLRRVSRTGDLVRATINGRRLVAWYGLVREVGGA